MKNLHMPQDNLTSFIKIFLPEGKVISEEAFELMKIASAVQSILGSIEFTATLESIYDVFYNLHYPISVVEPLRKDRYHIPYIETNSHAIFIGIDAEAMRKLSRFSSTLAAQALTMPSELHNLFEELSKFRTKPLG